MMPCHAVAVAAAAGGAGGAVLMAGVGRGNAGVNKYLSTIQLFKY